MDRSKAIRLQFLRESRLCVLTIGQDYSVFVHGRYIGICRFIQPTEKGYNLLNLDTSKCILKHHLYPDKNSTPEKPKFRLHSSIRYILIQDQTKTG